MIVEEQHVGVDGASDCDTSAPCSPAQGRRHAAFLPRPAHPPRPVRAFFRWLARSNRILYNPASELERPKLERRLPRAVLTASEAEGVLAAPRARPAAGLRDRAMLALPTPGTP